MKKLLMVFLTVITLIGCGEKQPTKIEKSKFLFGTYINIVVYDTNEKEAVSAIEAAFDEIERVDMKLNTKSKGSLLYTLNNSKEKNVKIDQETKFIFENAKKISELSNGGFDMTMKPLRDVWGFDREEVLSLPSTEDIRKALSKIDYSKVVLTEDILSLEDPIVEIDTGAFLKGYAIKKASELLKEKGINSAYISAISSIETIGTKPKDKKWRIGLQNPNNPSEMLGIVNLDDKSMGVSGDYQTFIEIDGKKYHHVLDVNTGYPISDKKMVVVIGEDSFLGDMYSTAFFTMNIKDVIKYVENTKNLEVMIVDPNLKLITSNGFGAYLDEKIQK